MSLVETVFTIAKILAVILVMLTGVAYFGFAERRLGAFMQDRLGPNRVGPMGLLQPLADGLKLFLKEDAIPRGVDKFLFVVAPVIALTPALATFAVVPFGTSIELAGVKVPLQIAELNIGILYIIALTSLGVYGIILAGWSSNNKYSLLGGLRSSAQMISYELSLGLSVVGAVMAYGTLQLGEIVQIQGQPLCSAAPWLPRWGAFMQPLGFFVFLVASYAELNRLPFDLPEGEAELVAGYHTEYGSMKFVSFLMAEYTNMITNAAVTVTLFFGGWQFPGLGHIMNALPLEGAAAQLVAALLQLGAFTFKTGCFCFLFIWIRWTLPRFRYDQLMRLGWKNLLPLALANIFITGAAMAYFTTR